jgi:hypothetical protein
MDWFFGALWRAMGWNALAGALTGAGAAAAVLGGRGGPFAFLWALFGICYGTAAGLVHAGAQVPVRLGRPADERSAVAAVATGVSLALAGWFVFSGGAPDGLSGWAATAAVFGPYVALTPFLAVWGYAAASAEAAESAARRSGASSTSRVSGSASVSSRASSE